ncbi:MAG: ubiquitin [Oscillospiraceae bacterium]|nr:ubiquitin [Oscillospiraceae bacterium]
MAVTLEQVEQLREKADISYEEAKALLEQTDGNLLDALILLERQGRMADRSGFFSTRPEKNSPPASAGPVNQNGYWRCTRTDTNGDWRARAREIFETIRNLICHSTENQLEVWRKGARMTSVPILILVILVVIAFWITVPLLILGLFCGCRYRFTGPDLGREDLNNMMGTVTKTVGDMVDYVKHEFHGGEHRDR